MQHGELRTDRGSRLVSKFVIQFSFLNINYTFKTRAWSSYIFIKLVYFTNHNCVKWLWDWGRKDLSGIDSHPVPLSSSHVERIERGDPLLLKPTKNPKPNKNEDHDLERGDPLCSDIPEWLQEFRENLVDDRVAEHRDSHASSSHEPSLEPAPTRSVDLGKHSVHTYLPKDRNCEICQRTKITRAPCRRRIGGAVARAEKFDYLITADHKVLSESCESRNNHRYAVVVQDLATQWIQSYPCKKNFSGNTKELAKVLGAR